MAGGRGTYFFYGTLMDRDVLNIVSGLNLAPARLRPARLPGYRRVRVQDVQYPAVLRFEGYSVEGCVVHGIPAAAARIDHTAVFACLVGLPLSRPELEIPPHCGGITV